MLTWMPLFIPNSAEWEFICDFISRVALPLRRISIRE